MHGPRWGVGLLLTASLGSDGYSTLVNGLSLSFSVDFWVVNLVALPVVALGVAGYLAADAGAGPTEAAAITLEPQVPFRWSYSVVQGGGAIVGWACGAAIGPGTLIVILSLGPFVSWLSRTVPVLRAATTA